MAEPPRGLERSSVLLFDLGGVLVDIAAFDALRDLTGGTLDDEALKERWLRSPSVRSFELGQSTPDEFAARFLDEWRLPSTPPEFLAEFRSWYRQPHPGARELLARLRDGYHVSCFSNCNEVHWAQLGSFLDCFHSAFSSHLLGAIKPDERAFAAVLAELGVRPRDVSFFDDARPNVEAAGRLGIDAHLVGDFDDLLRVLEKGGLL